MIDPSFTNDSSIADGEVLLRRLQPDWIVPGNYGRMRIASAAFKHEELSILSYTLLQSQGRAIKDALRGYPQNFLCSITAGLAREMGQRVVYDGNQPKRSGPWPCRRQKDAGCG
jgi:hypothetical protein